MKTLYATTAQTWLAEVNGIIETLAVIQADPMLPQNLVCPMSKLDFSARTLRGRMNFVLLADTQVETV